MGIQIWYNLRVIWTEGLRIRERKGILSREIPWKLDRNSQAYRKDKHYRNRRGKLENFREIKIQKIRRREESFHSGFEIIARAHEPRFENSEISREEKKLINLKFKELKNEQHWNNSKVWDKD